MSDIRDELEKNFASAALQSDVQSGLTEDSMQDLKDIKQNPDLCAAPKSYTKEFQESFKSLSPQWQQYLATREKQTEKGFSELGNKLNTYKWAEKLFADRKERLAALGFDKLEDYIEKLVAVDDALCQNPKETFVKLADAYGIQNDNKQNASHDLQGLFLEYLQTIQKGFDQQRQNAASFDLERFENAKNEKGEPIHPFFQQVKREMQTALKSGSANNLEQAYTQAIWAKPETRDKMIKDTINHILDEKFVAAQIAHQASFLPNSKTEEKPREMTLREELEAQFRKEF